MKSSLTLLFLLVTSICSFACSCFDAGDFCTILPNAIEQNTLVVAGAPVRIIGHGMEFKISKVISGTESRSKITIWGDPGYLCRVYVTGFKQEDRLLMILNPVRQDRLEESTGNTERVGDYFISACGEFLVRLNGNNASNLDCINLEDEVPAPILVFPNPTSSSFRLAAAGIDINNILQINVYTSNGQLLYNKDQVSFRQEDETVEIATTHWGAGMYFIEIWTFQNKWLAKVLVVK